MSIVATALSAADITTDHEIIVVEDQFNNNTIIIGGRRYRVVAGAEFLRPEIQNLLDEEGTLIGVGVTRLLGVGTHFNMGNLVSRDHDFGKVVVELHRRNNEWVSRQVYAGR